jgi:hypothetical protein
MKRKWLVSDMSLACPSPTQIPPFPYLIAGGFFFNSREHINFCYKLPPVLLISLDKNWQGDTNPDLAGFEKVVILLHVAMPHLGEIC